MKFRIIEEAWGINRKTGERKVRRTAERIFTPEAGQIIEFPLGRRCLQNVETTHHIDVAQYGRDAL